MKKPIQRIEDMNFKRLYGLSFLAVFLLAGCNSKYTLWGSSEDPEIMTEQEVTYVQNAPVIPVVVPPEEPAGSFNGYQSGSADNQFVDYRQTAADYREFGERAPRDQYILSSGPGSNSINSISIRISIVPSLLCIFFVQSDLIPVGFGPNQDRSDLIIAALYSFVNNFLLFFDKFIPGFPDAPEESSVPCRSGSRLRQAPPSLYSAFQKYFRCGRPPPTGQRSSRR